MRLLSVIWTCGTCLGLLLGEAQCSTQFRGDPHDDFIFEIPDSRELDEDTSNPGNILNLPDLPHKGFLKSLRKNFEKRYSHKHHIEAMHQKFSKRITYLEDLRWSRSPNLNNVVKTILKSLQSGEPDRELRRELDKIKTISTRSGDEFRRCLEENKELPSLADADFNFVEEMMSVKANRLPPEMALPTIRNLTATMDSQRFLKISNTLLCIFKSVISILGGTSDKECKADGEIKPVPSYIRNVEENTLKALNTTLALRTLTASVETAMKFYQDALNSIMGAIFTNATPVLEVTMDGKDARLYDELSRCLEYEMSDAVKSSKFPDADVSEGTTGISAMRDFAKHVGRMRYLSIIFSCHLKVVEQRRAQDQYTHAVSDLHVWKWYEEGAYRDMDIDTEYETNDHDGHSSSNYNRDPEHGEAFEQVSNKDLELSMHFDQNHRLHIHPHHKGNGPN